MKKIITTIIKILILILILYTWKLVQINWEDLRSSHIFIYFSLIIFSILSDKYFYQGQKSKNNEKFEITSYLLAFTWFFTLIIPLLEYIYIKRYNLFLTTLGSILIIWGTIIRGIAIKKLGKFFSRDVEISENQKIVKIGIYKYIRHPAYAGNILQIIGFPLILNSYYSLFLSLITTSIFLWRIKVEEEFLIDKLPEYKKYMKETKKLIPKLW